MTPLKNVKADLDPVNGRLQIVSAVQTHATKQMLQAVMIQLSHQ